MSITSAAPAASLSKPSLYVSPGMPPLATEGKAVSAFEFWPMWLMYLPVVIQWLCLAIWHRSLTLPLLANPQLPLSGLVGVKKSTLFRQATGSCQAAILTWFDVTVSTAPVAEQRAVIEAKMAQRGLSYPVVCKPDIGCRGSGVKLVHNAGELDAVLQRYPVDAPLLIQRVADFEPEVGIFYVRNAGENTGKIVSMAFKYTPYVVGDGRSTLRELIEQDPRASGLMHLYEARHADKLAQVITAEQPYRLVFSASHCRGAIFRDGQDTVTDALTQQIDRLMQDLPEFFYGRLDVKFRDVASLQRGEDLQIEGIKPQA